MTARQNGTAMPQAYLFDEVFAFDGDPGRADGPIDPARSGSTIEQARREAYADGVEAGRRAAAEDDSARLAETATRLVTSLAELSETAIADRRRMEEEAVRLSLAAATKLAPALIAREPAGELEALLRDCLGELRDAPHLVVRVCADLAEEMRGRLDTASRETGYTGAVVVLGEPDISPGDGRIDWADGGIVRCRADIEAAIDKAVARYLGRDETPPQAEDVVHG